MDMDDPMLDNLDSDLSHSRSSVNRHKMARRKNIFIALAVIFLVIGIAGLAVILGMRLATYLSSNEYGIVFDAGSSHTSLYLYKWNSTKTNNTGEVKQIMSCEVEGGPLSDYEHNPSGAGPSLTECLVEAASNLPMLLKEYTPVYLGATAGMRILKLCLISDNGLQFYYHHLPTISHALLSEENPSASSQILQSVRDEFDSSGYSIMDLQQQAKILMGSEEAIGLWVTANYVAGTLGITVLPKWTLSLPQGNASTLGTLDLGGASTQVAFALSTAAPPSTETSKLTLYDNQLTLYADSFLCYGASEMRKQLLGLLAKRNNYEGEVIHPCYANGHRENKTYAKVFKSICSQEFAADTNKNTTMTIVGTGDNTACASLISDLFEHTFPNISMPTLPDRFMARGAFAYTLNDLNALDESKQTNYTTFVTAMNSWCSLSHSVISAMDLYDPSTVCVNAHYIHHLLSKQYGLSESSWSGIIFTNSLNDIDMGWTLGYMTNITSHLPSFPDLSLYQITDFAFYFCLVLTIVLIVLGVVAVVFACKYRRRCKSEDSFRISTPT